MPSRTRCIPDVPTLKSATGIDWTMAAWRGIVGAEGPARGRRDMLVPALKKVYESDEYKDFMGSAASA